MSLKARSKDLKIGTDLSPFLTLSGKQETAIEEQAMFHN